MRHERGAPFWKVRRSVLHISSIDHWSGFAVSVFWPQTANGQTNQVTDVCYDNKQQLCLTQLKQNDFQTYRTPVLLSCVSVHLQHHKFSPKLKRFQIKWTSLRFRSLNQRSFQLRKFIVSFHWLFLHSRYQ